MKGIALIRLQIGHLDSVCLLMRHDTVAPSLSLPPSVSLSGGGSAVPPPGGFPLCYPALSYVSWGQNCVFIEFKCIYIGFTFYETGAALQPHRRRRMVTCFMEILTEFTYIL